MKATPTPSAPVTGWPSRITREAMVDPATLTAHPMNWRTHPTPQAEALTDVLDRVGWVQRVIVNERTGNILDGHLRVAEAVKRGSDVPVVYVDLSEEEERLVLATMDPLAGMAEQNDEILRELLNELDDLPVSILDALTYATLSSDSVPIGEVVEKQPKNKTDRGIKSIRAIVTACSGGGQSSFAMHCCIACALGFEYGFLSSYSPCVGAIAAGSRHKVVFIDNEYRDYKHEQHLAKVAEWRPDFATVCDVMLPETARQVEAQWYSLRQILEWAEELESVADRVIVIPKYDCLDEIPEQYVLGFSIPTKYGGTPVDPEAFRGRPIHLLGGSPEKQMSYLDFFGEDVVSIDSNYLSSVSRYGQMFNGKQMISFSDVFPELSNHNNRTGLVLAFSYAHLAAALNARGLSQIEEVPDARLQVSRSDWNE